LKREAIEEIKKSLLPEKLKTTLEQFLSNKVIGWDSFAEAISSLEN
jgi:hypothetical protein